MARPRKVAAVAVPDGVVTIEVVRDGVFYAADKRADKGDKVECPAEIAAVLIERGFARG